MSKRSYYVAIHSGESAGALLQEKGSSRYDFEIEATEEEAQELSSLLSNQANKDLASFWSAHTPYLHDQPSHENGGYDETLTSIYEHIHRLGTPETKQQIESMNILKKNRD
ncbi:hypothetical protein SAMN05444487_112114 [Marininema mesophilum]|uniref:Hydrolase n=1 Tax=Marininema mesophilum TaxID=1048340 RepID=A0A1H3A3M4_9BACL|nr:hypothetical protein [Marininema mesophilum]SDX24236.1 hypothetical protein SAMN05444487_112114 [Marininema mesophilum]